MKLNLRKTLASFQSTHPLRGATGVVGYRDIGIYISIHAPLAGCDFIFSGLL